MHFFIDAALEWKIDKSISEALALILSFGLVDAKANPPITSHRSGCSGVNELHGQWQTKQKYIEVPSFTVSCGVCSRWR